MRMKRFASVLLTAALAVSFSVPVGAAGSSFADVTAPDTAVHADILRLMGVVSGVGGGNFNPKGNLTRAEFCTMVVNFMGKGDQVPLHSTRTIFSDVTASHWSLGYVNLAASLRVEAGEEQVGLISGVGNGKFEPDSKLNLAQAATILLRVLGYGSKQTGSVWPQSYLNLAASIGLTDGISAGPYDALTRAQAARLFANALGCKNGAGQPYYTTLGTAREDVLLLAVGVTSGDGTSDSAIRTSLEADPYLAAVGEVRPTALLGKRGALVLNEKQEIVTFVPDDSTAQSLTLSGDAQPSYLKGSDGKQYTVPGGALVYTASAREGEAYATAYGQLKSGMQVTLYSERGKVVALYAGGSMATSDGGAVVVTGEPIAALFHELTGGGEHFTVQKNRQTIALADLAPYDVVTYDSLNNTLIASDLRLTCVYEDASPNAKAPTSITVLGHTFEVLDSAWDSIREFSLGDTVSLLLTADGKVAGMARPGSKTRSTAVGMATDSEARVLLPNGGTIVLKGEVKNGERFPDRLVTISSNSRGKLTASLLELEKANGSFDRKSMTVDGHTVAMGVRVYEQVRGGAMVATDLTGLSATAVALSDLVGYHRDTSGLVDYLVLADVTGNVYTYGKLVEGERLESGSLMTYTNRTVTVENGTGGLAELVTAYAFKDGGFGGVAPGSDGRAAAVVELEKVEDVSPGDFFTSQGITYVNADGTLYRVSEHVECYKTVTKSWFTGDSGRERLAACRAFSSDLTVYVDPVGGQVRIVTAD